MQPSYHLVELLHVSGCGMSFFGRFKSFFISGCSEVSFDFGVLVGGGELKVLLLCHLVSSLSQGNIF